MSTIDNNNGGSGGTRDKRASTMYTVEQSQQAVPQNVQREVFKQFELLLLKKRAGNDKVVVRQGLLVSIPQIEKVSAMSSAQVSHQIDVMSNVLVKMSTGANIHQVFDVLIKMCDSYLDDPHNMVSNDKKGRPDLPSASKDDVESDVEVSIPYSTSDSLSGYITITTNVPIIVNNNINNSSSNIIGNGLPNNSNNQMHHSNSIHNLGNLTLNGSSSSNNTPLSSSLASNSSTSSLMLSKSGNDISLQSQQINSSPLIANSAIGSPASSPLMNSGGGLQTQQQSQEIPTEPVTVIQLQPLIPFNIYKYVGDESPLYYILHTMYIILLSHLPHQPTPLRSPSDRVVYQMTQEESAACQLSSLQPKIITFLFNLLQYTVSAPVRYKAGHCLQVISVCSLDVIAQLFVTRLQSGSGSKSDEFYREYSTMQRAAKYLEFGFARQQQADGTNQYFAKLVIEMEKASRTVFMQSICFTLLHSFPHMFNSGVAAQTALLQPSFWSIVTKMYDYVLKWTKKGKLKALCIKTAAAMCGSSEEMITTKGADLLQLISKGLAESGSKGKRVYLEALVQYFSAMKSVFGNESRASAFYQQHVDIVLPAILPKKSSPSEPILVLEVMMTMGRFSPSVVVSRHILAVLAGKQPDYSNESKAVILKLYASLNSENGDAMRVYDRTLWQSLDPIYNAYDGDTSPLRYVLLCFPSLCSIEHRKDVGDRITRWTWHQDSEVATMATVGITRYLATQPHSTFPTILFQMLTYITNYFGEPVGLSKVVRNINMVIEEFISLHHLPNGTRKMSANIDATLWRNLRETCEGVALYLLSAPSPSLWPVVQSLVKLTGHPLFREIDQQQQQQQQQTSTQIEIESPIYLCDHLVPAPASPIANIVPHMCPDLVHFLLQHDGSLQNSVNWGWTRLRKKWHPKSQPGLAWRNNLAFLLLSLRLNNESPEITAVEDQLLTEVLTCYFQEREGKTAEEMAPVVAEISLYLHRSCYDTVFRFLEQERGRELKRKKKEVFYTQEYVIIYLCQLVTRLTVIDYDSTPSVRTTLREVTYFWITNPQIFQSLSVTVKNHIAKLFKNFLYLDSKSTIPKGEISLNKASYTKLIFQCLQSLSENTISNPESVEGDLELNLQRAFNILVAVGCLDDFKKEIVPHLIRSLTLGQHIHQMISENMAIFLRRSPKYLNEYIEKSYDNEKSPTSSLSFLRALVINFTDYYLQWSHNFPPERLLHLILFHMVSVNNDARKLVSVLANRLMVKNTSNEFKQQIDINSPENNSSSSNNRNSNGYSHGIDQPMDEREVLEKVTFLSSHIHMIPTDKASIYEYSRLSLLYSNSMSNKYQWMTPALFEECVLHFPQLPFSHKLSMLTLLAPWSRNFFWLISGGGEGVTVKSAETVLDALMNLTLQAREYPSMHNSLEVLWGELASSGDHSGPSATYNVYKKVIEFLKEKYHQNVISPPTNPIHQQQIPPPTSPQQQQQQQEPTISNSQLKPFTQQDYRLGCRMVASFISRRSSQHWMVAMEYMCKTLRHYSTLPPSPSQFVTDFLGGNESESISLRSEEAYLYILEDLAFEFQHQDVLQLPRFIPTVLINAIMVSPNGKRLVDNILLSLVVQQPTIDTSLRKEAEYLIATPALHDWKENERQSMIRVLVASLGETIVEIWEQLVLQFAVRSNQQTNAIIALDWYQSIRTHLGTKKDGMDGLLGLCCGLWRSCVMGDVEKMYRALEVLNAVVATGSKCIQSDTSYSIVIRLGSILLHTSYFSQFNASLLLLNRTIHSLDSNTPLQLRIVEEMIDILGAGMRTDQVVNRGISHPHTSMLTLWFAKRCIEFYNNHKRVALLDPIVSAVVLTCACMMTMAPNDQLTLDFYEYINEESTMQCVNLARLMGLLHPYYSYITGATNTPPFSTLELIHRLVAEFQSMYAATTPDLLSNLIRSVTEMVKSSMDSHKENDASFYLQFIGEMIQSLSSPSNPHSVNITIHPIYLIDFITVVTEVSQRSSSQQTRESAQNLIPFIMDNLPQGLQIGVFDFLKPFTGVFLESPSSMFGFQSDSDSINNLYTSLYLTNTYIFAVPSDSPLSAQMRRVLENNYKERSPSSHHLPSVTSPFIVFKHRPVMSNRHYQSIVQNQSNIVMNSSGGSIPNSTNNNLLQQQQQIGGGSSSSNLNQVKRPPPPVSKRNSIMVPPGSSNTMNSPNRVSSPPSQPQPPPPGKRIPSFNSNTPPQIPPPTHKRTSSATTTSTASSPSNLSSASSPILPSTPPPSVHTIDHSNSNGSNVSSPPIIPPKRVKPKPPANSPPSSQ